MTCCKQLVEGIVEELPFARAIATDFCDGPIEGFTECSRCGQSYSFRKLDWDDLQDVRILGFAPLGISLTAIAARLEIHLGQGVPVILVPPLAEAEDKFVQELLAQPPTRVAVVESWPGRSPLWRDITGLALGGISDWFGFLKIPKKKR